MDRPLGKDKYDSPWSGVIPLSMEAVLNNGTGGDQGDGNTQHPEEDPENPWVP